MDLVFLPMSCDRALAVHFPGSGISYQYLPASLCHGVAIDWVWSRIILRKHLQDVVMILHADVFPFQQVSISALLRNGGASTPSSCPVVGRRWTRCYAGGVASGGAGCASDSGDAEAADPQPAAGDRRDAEDERVCMWHFDTGQREAPPPVRERLRAPTCLVLCVRARVPQHLAFVMRPSRGARR